MTYDRIQRIRKKSGLSVPEFAKLLGVSAGTYYMWRSIRKPGDAVCRLLWLIEQDYCGERYRWGILQKLREYNQR